MTHGKANSYQQFLGPLNLGIDFIDIQLRAVGRAAAETLLWRLQHKADPFRSVLVRPRLIERQDVSDGLALVDQEQVFAV